jgi:hypothetical protein
MSQIAKFFFTQLKIAHRSAPEAGEEKSGRARPGLGIAEPGTLCPPSDERSASA